MFLRYPTHMRGLCVAFLLILIQASSCNIITGVIGQNVTLPCAYDAKSQGVLSFCWGRGKVPWTQCSNTVLTTQDEYVVFIKSPRYQLLGRLTEGDISLTILNAQRTDAGVYGCRVEVPGMFNDQKLNMDLIIVEDPGKKTVVTIKGSTAEKIQSVTHEQEMFMGAGNIGRMAAIFFFTIIIILVLIIRRTVVSREKQHLNTFTVENIYDVAN